MLTVFFKTNETGVVVFAISSGLAVWRIGPFQGYLAEVMGLWSSGGIPTIPVPSDVAEWLMGLPSGP